MSAISIRPERSGDESALHALIAAAFTGHPVSSEREPEIVDQLRRDGDLALSLLAEDGERPIGHIAFSPVGIGNGAGWYALGPASVLPSRQREGVGAALIERGLADMRERDARGIVLLGEPDYYGRFGFEHDPALSYEGEAPRELQRLVLSGDPPAGEVRYAPAFAIAR